MGLISDFPIPLNAGIFGLLDRQAADAIINLQEGNRYLPGLRAWVGFPTAFVYYERAERAAGEPKQTLLKLFKYAMDAIFSFSYKPLRLGMVLGGIVLAFSFFLSLVAIGNTDVPSQVFRHHTRLRTYRHPSRHPVSGRHSADLHGIAGRIHRTNLR